MIRKKMIYFRSLHCSKTRYSFLPHSKQNNRFCLQTLLFFFILILETCYIRKGFGEMCGSGLLPIHKKISTKNANFLDKSRRLCFPPGLHVESSGTKKKNSH